MRPFSPNRFCPIEESRSNILFTRIVKYNNFHCLSRKESLNVHACDPDMLIKLTIFIFVSGPLILFPSSFKYRKILDILYAI